MKLVEETDPVAIGIFLGFVTTSVQQDCCALFFGTCDQLLDAAFTLRANDWPKICTVLETSVDIQLLGSFRNLGEPLLGLSDHDQCTECHTSLSGGSVSSASNCIESIVFVTVRDDRSVILRSQVCLYTLSLGGSPSEYVLTRFVASNKADRFDGRFIYDKIHRLIGSVNYVDHSIRESCTSC